MTTAEAKAWLVARAAARGRREDETVVDAADPLAECDALVASLGADLGVPAFDGAQDTRGHPRWIAAERLVTWAIGGATAYVALVSRAPGRLVVGLSTTRPHRKRLLPLRLPFARRKVNGPRLDAAALARVLKNVAHDPARTPGPRRLLAASRDFFADRAAGAYEDAHRSLRAAYDLARDEMASKLGPPDREVASPGWFREALLVSEWTYAGRVLWLALHQDEVELPFMLSLGLRG